MPASEPAARPLARIKWFGSRCLRRVAAPAEPGSVETRDLLDEMWRVLFDDGGVGLAAPQIGVARRAVVIRDPDRPAGKQRIDLVNPVIEEAFGPDEPFEEGCLSFPGLYTSVNRPRGARLTYWDYDGKHMALTDEGLLARIIQHEVDHLDGVLFIDHLSPWRKLILGPRLIFILTGRLLGEMRTRK